MKKNRKLCLSLKRRVNCKIARLRAGQIQITDESAEAAIGLNFTVPATLKGSTTDDELNVALNIKSLDDFSPDSVARQVPEVNKLLELREALTALKGPMGNLPAFRTQLQALLENEESREQLLKEIGQVSNK
ncbi:hypothetical protein GSL01_26380 [Escherichia coli]|nr:hypothetical protein [Escherichia coli]